MSQTPLQALTGLLSQGRTEVVRDVHACITALRDLCPDHLDQVKVLGLAVAQGIPEALRETPGNERLAARAKLAQGLLVSGCRRDEAAWAVQTWDQALAAAPMPGPAPDLSVREEAMRQALSIALSKGQPAAAEEQLLSQLASRLELSPDRVATIRAEVQASQPPVAETFPFACPACGVAGRIPARLRGRSFACPRCQASLEVDAISGAVREVRPARSDQPPAGWPAYLAEMPLPLGSDWRRYRVAARDGMPQVLVPGGAFVMGSAAEDPDASDDELPARQILLSAYWIDLHPVTNQQYGRFVAQTERDPGALWKKWMADTGPHHAAVYVSWNDAMAYAIWADRQLPTEAQWERAARGGLDGCCFPWGDRWVPGLAAIVEEQQAARGWSYKEALERCRPVASYGMNGLGVFDLVGGTWEWCRDEYDPGWYVKQPDRDPCHPGEPSRPVTRGGGWSRGVAGLRVALRGVNSRGNRDREVGFRCVSETNGARSA